MSSVRRPPGGGVRDANAGRVIRDEEWMKCDAQVWLRYTTPQELSCFTIGR